MAKTIDKLLSQKPQFIHVDEPVSGSTNPSNQDVTVLPDGTIVSSVEGVSNRPSAQLWGLIKLMAEIIGKGHNPDGSHSITNADISNIAGINESKIEFNFRNTIRPSNGNPYSNTKDIVEEINYWSPYFSLSRHLSSVNESNILRKEYSRTIPNGWITEGVVPQGKENNVLIFSDEKMWFMDFLVWLRGSFSTDTNCYYNIGSAHTDNSYGYGLTVCVWLELWFHPVTKSGKAFPFGNLQYKNNLAAPNQFIPINHTTEHISLDQPDFHEYIANPANNIFVGRNGEIFQLVYCLRHETIDYSQFKYGVNDDIIRSVTNKPVVPSLMPGVWKCDDSYLIPIAVIQRKNQGLYHRSINPLGCAKLRKNAQRPTTFVGCFNRNLIGYFDVNGQECPNYSPSNYNANTDTFVVNNVTYYRSGLSISKTTGRPDNEYADEIYATNVIMFKPKSIRSIDYEWVDKLLAGQLAWGFTPVKYGTVTSMHSADIWGINPVQLVGFGISESSIFGTNNVGGVFIDFTNNGKLGTIDGVRRVWSDKKVSLRVPFRFKNGDDNSETKPNLNTYDSMGRVVSLNTTGLSGQPIIKTTPLLFWENGDSVVLDQEWTGIGTTSASCRIASSSIASHPSMWVYGEVTLEYPAGGGTPFIMDAFKVEKANGENYPFLRYSLFNEYTTFKYNGPVGAGNTMTTITLINGSNQEDFYTNCYLIVLKSDRVTPGTIRRVINYEPSTQRLVIDQPLSNVLVENDLISIARLEPNIKTTVFVDPYSRGVMDGIRRSTFTANSQGIVLVGRPIISSTGGVSRGTILTNVTPGRMVDVIYFDEDPFNQEFIVYIKNNEKTINYLPLPMEGEFEFLHIGKSFITNVGTANNGDNAYMGMIPGIHLPIPSNVKWIGTDDQYTTLITHLDQQGWSTLIPFKGLKMNYGTLQTNVLLDNVPVTLKSPVSAEENKNYVAFISVIKDQEGPKLLLATTSKGYIDYTKRDTLFLFDLRPFVGDIL